MAEPSTRRRRVTKPPAERRVEILAAALRLFHDRGFDATTVQDIAEAAEVAAGTVYLYFSSKEHILLAIHEDFHGEMQRRLEGLAGDLLQRLASGEATYEEAVDGVLEAIARYLADQRTETTVICRYLPRLHDEAYDEDREERAAAMGGRP
jgi:AcrR family transcriptional regulator